LTRIVELPSEAYPAQLQADLEVGGQYSFETARAMMWLSQLAYESDAKKIDAILRGWRLMRTAPLQSAAGGPTDTRGFVVHGWGGTIAVFAGTDPLIPKNWLTDFNSLRVDDIHAGFAEAVVSIAPQLRRAVAHDAAAGPLFFTGHSMGGALAVVAAKQLNDIGVTAVYTFGMPRCGDDQFVREYGTLEERTYRLVHGDDIVPTVPPPELGFRHVGRLLRCRHGASFDPGMQPDAGPSDEPVLALTVLVEFENLLGHVINLVLPAATQPGLFGQALRFLPPAIGDHIPSQYLHALGFRV
jgi:triacylglycerol lipase